MDRFTGIIGMAAVTVIVLAGALNTPGGAVQDSAPSKPYVPVTYRAAGRAVPHDFEALGPSTSARDRAILDREWYEGTQERCTARSPFAGPAATPPAC